MVKKKAQPSLPALREERGGGKRSGGSQSRAREAPQVGREIEDLKAAERIRSPRRAAREAIARKLLRARVWGGRMGGRRTGSRTY